MIDETLGNTFMDRLIAEKVSLDEKLFLLGKFIAENSKFKELNDIHKQLLSDQFKIMKEYSNILEMRINLITKDI